MIKLTVNNGLLSIGDDALIYFYPAGDVDTIPWPLISDFRDNETLYRQLRIALFDAREVGDLPDDTKAVLLPDGRKFSI